MSSFAAGFFGQLNNDITDQRQYIRARVDEDRTYLREQGLKRQAGIQEQRGLYEQAARNLTRRGVDESLVLGVLQRDPEGLMQLSSVANNDTSLSANSITDIISIAGDYSSDSSMQEIINSILPMAQAQPADTDPVTSRRRSLGAWLGLDVEDALSNEVYSQQITGGMTGDDILSSMNLPIRAEGSGGVTLDFSGPAAPMGAADLNALIARANEEYDVPGMILALGDRSGAVTDDDSMTAKDRETELGSIRQQITALEAVPRSGASRLNAILAIPNIEVGLETMFLAEQQGSRMFNSDNGFSGDTVFRLLGAQEGDDTSDDGVNRSGLPENTGASGSTNPPLDSTPEPMVDADGRPIVRPRAAGTVDIDENTKALPVTQANADRVIDSYFNDNPNSPGLYVRFEGDDLPTLIRGEDYVENIGDDAGVDFYKSVIPEYGAARGERGTRAPISDFEYVLPRRDTSVSPTQGTTGNPVADESMAILSRAIGDTRSVSRPNRAPASEDEMVAALSSAINSLDNPAVGAAIREILSREGGATRDDMITEITQMIGMQSNRSQGLEDLLMVLGTLRNDN